MLSEEQIEQVKKQIISQIQENFPEDKKHEAISQISSMNSEEIERFVKENNLIKENSCVFCSIISDNIKTYKIDENEEAVAILEINPVSKAHSLVIPKSHILFADKVPEKIKTLVENVSKKIKKKFKPKEVLLNRSSLFGHSIINILPQYKNENLNSKRIKMDETELENIQKELTKTKERTQKPRTKKITERIWLPRRIP